MRHMAQVLLQSGGCKSFPRKSALSQAHRSAELQDLAIRTVRATLHLSDTQHKRASLDAIASRSKGCHR